MLPLNDKWMKMLPLKAKFYNFFVKFKSSSVQVTKISVKFS